MSVFKNIEIKRTFGKSPKFAKRPGVGTFNSKFGKQDMQFPGQGGMFPATESIEEIRQFIKNQKRLKGYNFNVSGGASSFPLDISGEARVLLGLSILALENFDDPNLQPDTFTLTINNEIVINQTHPGFLSPLFMDEEYYQFLRPLSGQDDISVTFTNPNPAQNVSLAVYYI